jgi:hypothetical protein
VMKSRRESNGFKVSSLRGAAEGDFFSGTEFS